MYSFIFIYFYLLFCFIFFGGLLCCLETYDRSLCVLQVTKIPFLRERQDIPEITGDTLQAICANHNIESTPYLNLVASGIKKVAHIHP